jgi:hypothetical protein
MPDALITVRWFNRTLVAVIALTFVTLILWVALAGLLAAPGPSIRIWA